MKTVISILLCFMAMSAVAQRNNRQLREFDGGDGFNQTDDLIRDASDAFRDNENDSTRNQEIPKGIYVWTVDRKFGDIRPAVVDTMQHMFMRAGFNSGLYGEYNTTGNNYTARQNRIVIDRPLTSQFIFTQPYSYVMKQPDEWHFTNALSPITNLTYDNCGDKTNGEDHIDAKFAVNVNKKLGLGFNLNYAYARGYFANQSTSHFGATFYGSYLGDRYQAHALFSTYHQKVTENGGITDDKYITNPESFDDSYMENEIPTVLEENWNRNNNLHFFLTHRYSVGFYRKEKMTDAEIKARQFAKEAERDRMERDRMKRGDNGEDLETNTSGRPDGSVIHDEVAMGRPDGATIVGDEPALRDAIKKDTVTVSPEEMARLDSIAREKAILDSIDATMKDVFVPVTSFIHTAEVDNYDRIYQAYDSPANYYANTYYDSDVNGEYAGKKVYDNTKLLSVKNTFAIAMLEGFNKWAKAGLRAFAAHELRKFEMPDVIAATQPMSYQAKWTENTVSIGGQLIKSQGKTLHYNLLAETWLLGEDAGQLKVDFKTDFNFPLWGDTVTLAAKAYFYRLNPTFYQRNYHSKNLWWDGGALDFETRTRIEGIFSYPKTKTSLRVAVEEIQNYTYFGMSYDATTSGRTNMTAGVRQEGGNINLMTAQLRQDFRLGILNWENIITYQNSSNQSVLPVPDLNVFTNLYIRFKIAKVLDVMLGADAYYFTKYYAPDYCPQLGQFAVQEKPESRVEIGGYPFVDIYANMHLKHTRFFVMYSHANAGSGNGMSFLAPHYPTNSSVLRMGVSWNFFN